MALSLVCKQCDTPLRSVAEAQSHSDATGHIQFEESKEPVLNLVCTECGKPCRSQTEKDIHSKRTGHSSFVDKTDEATAMDTESEMKQAAQALKEEAGTSEGAAADKELKMVPPQVDVGLRQQLEDMGFAANRATRALHFTGTSNLEQAVNWIVEHENDKDIDEPLLVPEGPPPKPKLSPEEARKQAEELLRAAKAKREKEEAELERVREAERIRSGKELLAAKRQEDDLRLKRNLEARRREKEEEARARDRIRQKLDEDRRARRLAKGLPAELTEEEQAAEAARAAEKERAAAKPRMGISAKPVMLIENLRSTLVAMKKAYGEGPDAERLKTCQSTLMKYCANIAKDPAEDKFRRIRLSNAAFQTRVGSLKGGIEFLEQLGFQRSADGDTLEMPREAASSEALNAAGAELQNALTNPFFGAL